jgi:imidazolonepropionase-like amidohydrolase
VNIVKPVSLQETSVSFLTYVSDESKFNKGAGSGLDAVEMEDEEVVEAVQKGVRSRYYSHGRYSPNREQGTHHFHRIMAGLIGVLLFLFLRLPAYSQFASHPHEQGPDTFYLLRPDRVFDGEQMHPGWQVVVHNGLIEGVGPEGSITVPAGATILPLKGMTLLPGLIEGHSHLFLHPYNETPWDDQVLKESRAERMARATVHARKTLLAGFTTTRDLGTEGAGYDDVGLKEAIEKGIIPGPHMLVATRAIVATGSYGPNQLSYDYRWGLDGQAAPTFTVDELKKVVEVAGSSGRPVVVHSSTPEGMRRAIAAGVTTIEHGDGGTPEIFAAMKAKGIALCPTLAAGDAVAQYKGWKKGSDPEPSRIKKKRLNFKEALASGVTICMGGDVGVFTHGDNAREMEAMADYGMLPLDVLRSATSVNADVFKINDKVGRVKAGLLADLLVVEGDPSTNISLVRKVKWVMKEGVIYQPASSAL